MLLFLLAALVPVASAAPANIAWTDDETVYAVSMYAIATRYSDALDASHAALSGTPSRSQLVTTRNRFAAIKADWDNVPVPAVFAETDASFGPVIKGTIRAIDLELRFYDTGDITYGNQAIRALQQVTIDSDVFVSNFKTALGGW